jgi:hypothetical protein
MNFPFVIASKGRYGPGSKSIRFHNPKFPLLPFGKDKP